MTLASEVSEIISGSRVVLKNGQLEAYCCSPEQKFGSIWYENVSLEELALSNLPDDRLDEVICQVDIEGRHYYFAVEGAAGMWRYDSKSIHVSTAVKDGEFKSRERKLVKKEEFSKPTIMDGVLMQVAGIYLSEPDEIMFMTQAAKDEMRKNLLSLTEAIRAQFGGELSFYRTVTKDYSPIDDSWFGCPQCHSTSIQFVKQQYTPDQAKEMKHLIAKYNPPGTKMPALPFSQMDIAEKLSSLSETFKDMNIQVNYSGLNVAQLNASMIPKEKLSLVTE